jgi:glycosyltransferase involved in cell wall biosynthesis
MADVIGNASLVVLLSDYEAHPVAVMEALSLGRPVLVTRGSGLAELVDEGLAAGLSPGADSAAVAEAIAACLRQPVLPDRARLATWDTCTAQLLGLYRQAVGSA